MYQNKNISVNRVEQQKPKKLENWFPEVIKELYRHYSQENQIVRHLIIGKRLLRSDKPTSFASDKSCHCAFTSPILDSSCFKLHFYVVQ